RFCGSLQLLLRPGPKRIFLRTKLPAHARWNSRTAVAVFEAVALLVERLDNVGREDRWGKGALLAVDHQVEVDVAAVSTGRRRVEVGDHITLAHLLAFVYEQELLVEALG